MTSLRIFSFLLALMGNATAVRSLFTALVVLLVAVVPVLAQTPDSLNPDASGSVQALATQSDGKILLGGGFTTVGGQTRNRLARLNADGSLDASFNPNADGNVNSLAVQADGKILVGGEFTTLGGQTRNHLARLNTDGSLDTAFNPGANNYVTSLAVQADGKILVGGYLYLVRLNADGSLDVAFNPSVNIFVHSLAVQMDGKILIGGFSLHIIGETPRNFARLNADGSLDTSFDPKANDSVSSLAVQADGKILVAGDFIILSGQTRNHIARLNADGSLDAAFDPNANDSIYSIVVQADGKILVAGDFIILSGQTRNHVARLTNDTAATSSLTVTGGNQIDWTRGGSTPEVSQVTFERWTGSEWAALGNATRIGDGWRMTDLSLPASGWVRACGRTGGGFYTGSSGIVAQTLTYGIGPFPDIAMSVEGLGNLSAGAATVDFGTVDWSAASGATKTITVTNEGNATLSDLAVSLVGANPEDFTVGSLPATSLAPGASMSFSIGFRPRGGELQGCALAIFSNDGDESPFNLILQGTGNFCDLTFNPGANDNVDSLAVQPDGKILVGGGFTAIGGQPRNSLARLNADGGLDTAFDPNANYDVSCLTVQPDGKTLVGGLFTTLGGQTRNRVARLNVDGSLDAFNPNADSVVHSLAVQSDGKVLVAGAFTTLGALAHNRVARLNANGSHDTSFNPNANSTIISLVTQADGKILLGGTFTTIDGQARNRIARLKADGSLDVTFNPNANSIVYSLAVQADGKILIAGGFTSIGGQARNRIARLNTDGSLDTGFNPNANSVVYSLAVQADGKILVAGYFTTLDGQPRNRIARLNADGSLDAAFNPRANNYITSLAVQVDGKVLVGGAFTTVGGQPRNRLARLTNDTAATSFLAVTGTTQIDWTRAGSAPEVSQVTFECWTGSAWASLGNATRVAGGWRMTGLALPVSGQIRAQGRTSGGYFNGSSGIVEQTAGYSVPLPDAWRFQFFGTTANTGAAADHADPDGDGLPNLLERACNLNPTHPGVAVLTAGTGTSGLPLIRRNGEPPVFAIQYLRLKTSANPGVSYIPQFSFNLEDTGWSAATGTETVESIDADWERVTVTDSVPSSPYRFGRVKVIAQP